MIKLDRLFTPKSMCLYSTELVGSDYISSDSSVVFPEFQKIKTYEGQTESS